MEKEEFVFCITDNSPDAIVFSAQGVIRYLNPAAVTLFGADGRAA
jgi:PAS domain-containing protein